MQEILLQKLHQYIASNHPDLMLSLQQEGKVTLYLQDKIIIVDALIKEFLANGKPAYIIEETCMEAFTRDLRPSKFNYLLSLLKEEFEKDYNELKEDGILSYEVINMISACNSVFEIFGFTEETEADRGLRYAIIAEMQGYLESK